MDVILEFLKSVFDYLITNYALYLVVVMGFLMTIIYLILAVVKKPIKKLTNKIQNSQLRHLANKVIIVLSFAFAVFFWFILHYFIPEYFAFNGVEILLTGAFPVVLYAIIENLGNPTIKELSEKVVSKVKEIAADGKITTEEKKNAEKELNKLLKK